MNLTDIIGLVARGKSAKAIAGTMGGSVTALFGGEVIDAFVTAFQTSGAVPAAELLGTAAGVAFLGLVNAVIVYQAPKNEPAD